MSLIEKLQTFIFIKNRQGERVKLRPKFDKLPLRNSQCWALIEKFEILTQDT